MVLEDRSVISSRKIPRVVPEGGLEKWGPAELCIFDSVIDSLRVSFQYTEKPVKCRLSVEGLNTIKLINKFIFLLIYYFYLNNLFILF